MSRDESEAPLRSQRVARLTPVESLIAEEANAFAPIVYRVRVERLAGISEG